MTSELSSYPVAEITAPPGAPVPESLAPFLNAFYVERDGVRLRVLLARNLDIAPRGTIIISPGRTEFVEKYFEMVEDFISRRFTVLVIDHRGQGLSTRLLDDPLQCYVRRFQDFADDMGYIIDKLGAHLPKPQIIVAHSMGGCVALQAVISKAINPSAVICSAPMLGVYEIDTPLLRAVFKGLAAIGLRKHNIPFQRRQIGLPTPFKHNKLSSDPVRFMRWAAYFTHIPALRIGRPTIGWIAAAINGMAFVNRRAAAVKMPTLIISAGGDPIVDQASHLDFIEKSGAEHKIVPGALHEVFLEKDEYRAQFYDFVDDFLERHAL